MHPSSLENMELCYRKYIAGTVFETDTGRAVLDVGGADVNGSYRDIFCRPHFRYMGADLNPGEGVSIVLDDPYRLPLDDASIDIVLSGQALEHCEFFWLSFAEMIRVLKPDGFLFLIVPSAGPEHRYPVDCYRFYPDAYRALAKYANCHLIDVWRDERGPWKDLVGVFRKQDLPLVSTSTHATASPANVSVQPPCGAEDEERLSGDTPYLDVLSFLHRELAPAFYLEIGVRHGRSLALAQSAALGVDPNPEISVDLPSSAQIVAMSSDDFFRRTSSQVLPRAPDLVFIDGMHLFEFALRDFMNVERVSHPGTLVVFDDIFPNHSVQAERKRHTRAWTGDVWKVAQCLKVHRPDLFLLSVDAWPAGLLLVGGLDATNRVLWDQYNPIVRAYAWSDFDVPNEVLQRVGAVRGRSEIISQVCTVLRRARDSGAPSGQVVEALRAALENGASVLPDLPM